ncbi:MAG: MogA/MoaB family molybdenum cofactor biosynthesis protein [Phycisphaerales bacterium]|jgi:molybdenum cofactor biosynthesis protein B|nr:MogA/MoaB family molybdenum cofactor biosynthesis protein [Phycisphaerales bacterium]
MSHQEHKQSAQALSAHCAIITLSDTRTPQTDRSGQTIQHLLTENGHTLTAYHLIPDEADQLIQLVQSLLKRDDVEVIITNGGTGFSPRDRTIDTIQQLFDKPMPGFGELFRMLSHQQIGAAAMLSRACAGIATNKPIFCLPGSTKAVELALTGLILPELRHLLAQLHKH